MSRVLKFRAWIPKLKQLLPVVELGYGEMSGNQELLVIVCRKNEFEPRYKLLEGEFILEQFTGLLDKNGKEIYEGDLVRVQTYVFPKTVEWCHVGASWNVGMDALRECLDLEVIGNVHEKVQK